jgi:hypothetical protein
MNSLSKLQGVALAVMGTVIISVQLFKFNVDGVEGSGWILAFLIGAALWLPLLGRRAHPQAVNQPRIKEVDKPVLPTPPKADQLHQFVRYRSAVLWEQLPQWVSLPGVDLFEWGNPNPAEVPSIPPAEWIHAQWRSSCYAYVYALVCVAEFKKDRHFLGGSRQKKLGTDVAAHMVEDAVEASRPELVDPVRVRAVAFKELYVALDATGKFAQAIVAQRSDPDVVLFDFLASAIGVVEAGRTRFYERLRDFTKETFRALA